jgi:hypothetical protein
MQHLEPIFKNSFIAQTYSCIKGRGIHRCLSDLRIALGDVPDTKYCLKVDIKKFYPSVDREILKAKLRTKLKDQKLLVLLDEIIDSNRKGLPLGNYLSQWLANFYLNGFDHWLKEDKSIKNYFRYCDDLVILHSDKRFLHSLRLEIQEFLRTLGLELSNYQVFLVSSRGIDFVGYVSYHTHTLIRKSIKIRYTRMIRTNRNSKSIASYNGWLTHADCINLQSKYLKTKNMIQALLTQEEYDACSKIYSTYNAKLRRSLAPFRTVTISGEEMQCGPPPNYRMGPMTSKEIANFNSKLIAVLKKAGIERDWTWIVA